MATNIHEHDQDSILYLPKVIKHLEYLLGLFYNDLNHLHTFLETEKFSFKVKYP